MNPHSRAAKKNTSHGIEVLPQDTAHLIQRPSYQRGGPCKDQAGNWATRRPPDYRKETQTVVVWSCFPFIRSGQNHLARGGKTTSGNRQAWSSANPIGEWRTGNMEKAGYTIICSAPTTIAVKGLMMIMMIMSPTVTPS